MQIWEIQGWIEPLLLGVVAVGGLGGLAALLIALPRARRETQRLLDAQATPTPESTVSIPRGRASAEAHIARGPESAARVAPSPASALPTPAKPTPTPTPDIRSGLRRSRSALWGRLEDLFSRRNTLDASTLSEIEEILFAADLGVKTADDLLEAAKQAGSTDAVHAALEARALEILSGVSTPPEADVSGPKIVLIVGVNGSGKTTSIGKLAARHIAAGKNVLLAAADTFRAAAIDQLGIWAERVNAEIVKGSPGGDPAAVAFDAVKAAQSRDVDVVLIDTAGRLQTQGNLMDELGKIARTVKKLVPDAPHEVLLVLDGNTGQNAIRQAQEFSRQVDVTGIVLSKLDGTAKGGVVLGIAQEVGIPVRFVGVGEGVEDLIDFEPGAFVRALFDRDGHGAPEYA